jgi:hypothetical protein
MAVRDALNSESPVRDVESMAVGVPVYSRTAALEQLLESVPEYVSTVYVADNGPPEQQSERWDDLFYRDWPFSLQVIDLEHDVGIGACRAAIADAVGESYLWVGDCDMEFLREGDLRQLLHILESWPRLGGVSGWLHEEHTIRSGGRDLVRQGGTLLNTVRESPTVRQEPLPHATFDMIPQCGLFRTAIYDDYAYDSEMYNTEHVDFFLGHQETEWEFASTPAVVIAHHRHIDEEYRESREQNHTDLELLAEKWGIQDIHIGHRPDWMSTRERSPAEQAFDLFRRVAPSSVWMPVRRLANGVVR